MRIRIVKTASGSQAVQVVDYRGKRAIIRKHLGSAKNQEDLLLLKELAHQWMAESTGQLSFLAEKTNEGSWLKKYRYRGFRYGLVAEVIGQIFQRLGLNELAGKSVRLFLDLALVRCVEPASKRKSVRLLSTLFGINYNLSHVYRHLPEFVCLKDPVEQRLISFAQRNLGFDFRLVLYDVTTLYFETFEDDPLRRVGFSKDNKIGQPQILVGLVVNREGFPLSFAVFPGNTFEGKTLLPVILDFKKKHRIEKLTVVADAAMISRKNVGSLKAAGLSYIVGARLGNLSPALIQRIDRRLPRVDGACLRLKTEEGFLVLHFSSQRYAKDKHEMEKQLEKAQEILDGKRDCRRHKFLFRRTTAGDCLNTTVIEKTKRLLGIKGYHTDLDLPERVVIDRYADLWQIEKAFRISKNDLTARPIYHFRQPAIIAHLLICVVSLAVLKYLEIKTGKSAHDVMEKLKSVTDGRILNLVTGKEVALREEITAEVQVLLRQINSPH